MVIFKKLLMVLMFFYDAIPNMKKLLKRYIQKHGHILILNKKTRLLVHSSS